MKVQCYGEKKSLLRWVKNLLQYLTTIHCHRSLSTVKTPGCNSYRFIAPMAHVCAVNVCQELCGSKYG